MSIFGFSSICGSGVDSIVMNIVTPPSVEPVSLVELQDHIRFTTAEQNDNITSIAKAARFHIENAYGVSLVTQTWKQIMDHVSGEIWLRRWPVQSISSIERWPSLSSTVAVAVPTTKYFLVKSERRSRVVAREMWEEHRGPGGYEITFVSGYGATGASVPDDWKQAIKVMTAYLFEHPGDSVKLENSKDSQRALRSLPPEVRDILRYRKQWF